MTFACRLAAPVLAMMLVPGCGGSGGDRTAGAPNAEADDRIECRIGNARQFERFCTFALSHAEEGRIVVLRKPDGGFRRLLIADDGRGVVAFDGAEPAIVSIIDEDRIEVEIGGDTFRLPATIG